MEERSILLTRVGAKYFADADPNPETIFMKQIIFIFIQIGVDIV